MSLTNKIEDKTNIQLNEDNESNKDNNKSPTEIFNISCLQALILNKMLPPGYKLETEESFVKTTETNNYNNKKKKNNTNDKLKNDCKKKSKKKKLTDISVSDNNSENKTNQINKDYNSNSNNSFSNNVKRSSTREKKPYLKDDLGYVESRVKCKDPKLLEISKRCDKIIQKLKKHPFGDRYFQTISNIPNLADVEKKVKLYQYNTIRLFAMDIRNVWKYYYSNAANNPELYQKTVEITQYFEEIFSEIEELPFDAPYLENLNKKIKSIEDHLQMRSKNNVNSNMYIGSNKSNRAPIPLQEKPMTIIEKKALGDKIRMLSPNQMKGIINILSDQCSIENNSKYFEFNIDTLPTKKLRDLEKYVKKCLKTTSNSSKNVSTLAQNNDYIKNETKSINSNINDFTNSNPNYNINNNNNNYNSNQINDKSNLANNQSQLDINNTSSILNNKNTTYDHRALDSLSSSDDDNDSKSLSSLNFKKGN